MKSLLLRIGAKIQKTGVIDGNDVIRLLDYDRAHPMWKVTADDRTLAAYDAIMANVKEGLA
jgi:hypothetical protein